MPDNKTYAVVLRSKNGNASDVQLKLSSDSEEYAVSFESVEFDAVASDADPNRLGQTDFKYESPVVFIVLPRADPLLLAEVDSSGTPAKACLSQYGAITEYYRKTYYGERHLVDPVERGREEAMLHIFREVKPEPVPVSAAKALPPVSCPVRYREARAVVPQQPDYPATARFRGAAGTVLIMVDLDADGHVAESTIYRSSGDIALDNAAWYAASHSTYEPEIFRCVSIPGSYIFHAAFDPN